MFFFSLSPLVFLSVALSGVLGALWCIFASKMLPFQGEHAHNEALEGEIDYLDACDP